MADNDSEAPVLRKDGVIPHQADKLGPKLADKTEKLEQVYRSAAGADNSEKKEKKGPAGGFDDTPVPRAPPGYTVKITFHKAENLPFADFGTLSSDPYVLAILQTDLPKRHKQDPDLKLRTPTIHRNTDPEWETEWIIANIPATGFHMKCRLYDEDPADSDDRLGNAHVDVPHIDDNWKGFSHKIFQLKKRMGSKRAYTLRGCAALVSRRVKLHGDLIVSVENLGRTDAENGGRVYTIGPLPWSQHHSPLIGRITGTKNTEQGKDGKEVQRYNFQSIQMQFRGPVPAELYHRYVEFRPFVAGMFTSHSIRGRLLNRALHHQHGRIYNYDRTTKYGSFAEPCLEMTKQFLDFVHYDEGGRIFTYVLTLDGQFRFTETGKEFGIDLLSKHTMHSDVSIYIAFSGEFFVRRVKHAKMHKNDATVDPQKETHPPSTPPDEEQKDNEEGSSKACPSQGCTSKLCSRLGCTCQANKAPPSPRPQPNGNNIRPEKDTDPTHYELIIDNDSGTYRPNAEKLPVLHQYLSANLPGLKIKTLDCQADAELQQALKKEQSEKKKASTGGKSVMYMQNLSMSSLSSSDEEDLNARAEAGEDGPLKESRYKREMHKFMDGGRDEHHGDVLHDQQVNTESILHDRNVDGAAEHEKGKQRDSPAPAVEGDDVKEKR
ncbi:C2 domain protein [Cladophialophora carrionii]|uniref:C2 domain protein n=1 Tax=Cladophialophora carrionii TaxID=86049 RepID=A0A1C1CDI3_9EURO|nr:C2 domain protein [Cladophialophora carrionii]